MSQLWVDLFQQAHDASLATDDGVLAAKRAFRTPSPRPRTFRFSLLARPSTDHSTPLPPLAPDLIRDVFAHISKYYYHETIMAMHKAPDWLVSLARSSIPTRRGDVFNVCMPTLSKAQTAYALALYLLLWFVTDEVRERMCMAVTWVAIDMASGMHDTDSEFASLVRIQRYATAFDTGHGSSSALVSYNDEVARVMFYRLLFDQDRACIKHSASAHIRAILGLGERTTSIEVQLCNYHAHRSVQSRKRRQQVMRQHIDALPLEMQVGLGLYRILELHVDVGDTVMDRDCFLAVQAVVAVARDCHWTKTQWQGYLNHGLVVGWSAATRCACDTGEGQGFRHRFGCDPFERVFVSVNDALALAYSLGEMHAGVLPGTSGAVATPSLYLFSGKRTDRVQSFWSFWYDGLALTLPAPTEPNWLLIERLVDAFYCANQRAFSPAPFALPNGLHEALVPTVAFAQWVRTLSRDQLREVSKSTSPTLDADLDVIVAFLADPSRWGTDATATAVAGYQVGARCASASADGTAAAVDPSLYQEDPPAIGKL